MINRIKKLTRIFLIDYYQNLKIFNNNKINKKSIYLWLLIILLSFITYFSNTVITYLERTGQPDIFLKIYFPIISSVFIFQLISLISTIVYYSEDIKDVLSLPIKPIEIVIAKILTVLSIMYVMEGLVLFIPLTMYGMLIQRTFFYFINEVLILVIFPVFFTLTVGIATIVLVQLSKIIRNKQLLQIIIVCILTTIFSSTITLKIIETINIDENVEQIQIYDLKIKEINNYFVTINPSIKVLTSNNLIEVVFNTIKIVAIDLLLFIIYIYIQNKIYLKNILKIIDNKSKTNLLTQNYKYAKRSKNIEYLKNDLIRIVRNPTFFIQYIFQYIIIVIFFALLLFFMIPAFIDQIETENMIEKIGIEQLKIQITLIFVGIIQILFSLSNLSLTAISREGKNAVFMKYIPIPLYKQFKLKAIPQMVFGIVTTLLFFLVVYLKILEISFWYYLITFIMCMLMNCITSYILLLVDFYKPNLDWISKESIFKDNGKKLFKYVFLIIIFLVFSYFAKIFKDINYLTSMIIINSLLLIFFIMLKIIIKKNINKIYKKVY